MRTILLFAAAAVCGCVSGCIFARVPGKRTPRILFPLIPILSFGLWLGALCLYAKRAGLPLTFEALFPDRLSKLIWAWALLPASLLAGFALGCVRSGGMRAFLRCCVGSFWHRASFGAICLLSLTAAIAGVVVTGYDPPSPLRISEVCCSNFTLMADPNNGEYEDYIELENTGTEPIRLGGYFISDRIKKRNLFRLPDLTLDPGEYLILWADGNGRSGEEGDKAVSLNFTLNPGETVYLTSPHGILLDSVTMAERKKNISMTKRDGIWIQAEGSPGTSGEEAARYIPATLSAPVPNLPSGFYADPVELILTADPGCTIRYTLDGSVPDETDPVFPASLTLYDISSEPNRVVNQPNTTKDRSGVITDPVDKGSVIRAAAFDGTGAHSEVLTAVYFVGKDTFTKYEGTAVLSIVADPDDLFGSDGIAVTGEAYDKWLENGSVGYAPNPRFMQKGRTEERDAEILLWDEAGVPILESACGIRLQGNSSRVQAVKRFTMYARPIYGTGTTFAVPVFSDRLSHSFFTRPNVHDVMAQALTAGLGLGGQDARPATVFLNGELYSRSYLRERYDEQYFLTRFGVKDGDLIVIADDHLDIGTKSDYADYRALMDWIQTSDCSDPEVYAAVCERIDVENFAAYVAANLYLNNTDWSTYKNNRLWRTRSEDGEGVRDGRWRWLVFDMDACYWTRPAFGDAPRASYDLFHYTAPAYGKSFLELPLFSDLLENPDFRALFTRTWLDLMNVTFRYENALPLLERYGLTEDAFWPEFLQLRPSYAADLLIRALELPGEACELTVRVSDPEGGYVRLNTVYPDLDSGAWSGTYITGCELTLTAEAARGWHFAGWSGDASGTDTSISLTPEGDTAVAAVFEKD